MARFNTIFVGVIGVWLLAVTCNADTSNADTSNADLTVENIFDLAQNVLNATSDWQKDLMEYEENPEENGRKSKFLPFAGAGLLPFHALCK